MSLSQISKKLLLLSLEEKLKNKELVSKKIRCLQDSWIQNPLKRLGVCHLSSLAWEHTKAAQGYEAVGGECC